MNKEELKAELERTLKHYEKCYNYFVETNEHTVYLFTMVAYKNFSKIKQQYAECLEKEKHK